MWRGDDLPEYQIDADEMVTVVRGNINAGSPDDSVSSEDISMVANIFGAIGPVVFVSVRGDSMIGANIFDGDTAVIDKGRLVNDGDLVAARYQGGYTLKYINIDFANRCTRLIPDNPDYTPMQFEEGQEPEILGVCIVTFSYKKHLSAVRRDEILRESSNIKRFGHETRRERINRAIEFLLTQKYSDDKPLIRYAKDWGFVFRILAEEGDFGMSDYMSFVRYLAGLPCMQGVSPKMPSSSAMCKLLSGLSGRYPAWQCHDDMKQPEFTRGCRIAESFKNAI